MTTEIKQPQAIFPDLPRDTQVVDEQGRLTMHWSLGLSQLYQALQANFKNEGILLPPLTATQIAAIQALYTPYIGSPLPQSQAGNTQIFLPDISGQTVFDSTNRVPKCFIITYDGATPPNIVTAAWKTYTLT